MNRSLREHLGIGLEDAERHDIRRFFRGSSWDKAFPADRMVPALRGTLGDLGIDDVDRFVANCDHLADLLLDTHR